MILGHRSSFLNDDLVREVKSNSVVSLFAEKHCAQRPKAGKHGAK